jgi:SAM-dependent methyltransferase
MVRVDSLYGLVEIASEDIDLLQDATGLSSEQCLERLASVGPGQMADAWRTQDPKTPSEIRDFYARSDHYIWQLLVWNAGEQYRERFLPPLATLARHWPPSEHPRALDYGAGIGTAAITLADLGYAVTIADIPGPTMDFARSRLEKRGVPYESIEITTDEPRLPKGGWDVVSCLDVIEHVPDAPALTRALIRAVPRSGGLALKADFNSDDEEWPMHLAAPRRRFADHRWHHYLRGHGLQQVGASVYRRISAPRVVARRARYLLWRTTGLHVERMPR